MRLRVGHLLVAVALVAPVATARTGLAQSSAASPAGQSAATSASSATGAVAGTKVVEVPLDTTSATGSSPVPVVREEADRAVATLDGGSIAFERRPTRSSGSLVAVSSGKYQLSAGVPRFADGRSSNALAVARVASGSAIDYGDLAGSGTSLTYDVMRRGVKESVTISGRTTIGTTDWVARFPIAAPGLTPVAKDGGWEFTDPNGTVVYTLPALLAHDSRGGAATPGNAFLTLSSTMTRSSQGWVLETRVPAVWLDSKMRVFPVVIDPTVLISPWNGMNLGYMPWGDNSGGAVFSGWTNDLLFGNWWGSQWKSYLQFNPSMFTTAPILKANLKLYVTNCDYQGNSSLAYSSPIHVHELTSPYWFGMGWPGPSSKRDFTALPAPASVVSFDITMMAWHWAGGSNNGIQIDMGSQSAYCRVNAGLSSIELTTVDTTNGTSVYSALASAWGPQAARPPAPPAGGVPTDRRAAPQASCGTTPCGGVARASAPQAPGRAAMPDKGIAIPAYIYPVTGAYQSIINEAPAVVVLNPNNGPQESQAPLYAPIITSFRSVNSLVFGYVRTGYAGGDRIDPQTVMTDIDTWLNGKFGTIDGIFFDESTQGCTGNSSFPNYYETVLSYARSQGMFTVLNPGLPPGTGCNSSTANVIVTYENSFAYPAAVGTPTWMRWALYHSTACVSVPSAIAASSHENFFYATDHTLADLYGPWAYTPTYWTKLTPAWMSGVPITCP